MAIRRAFSDELREVYQNVQEKERTGAVFLLRTGNFNVQLSVQERKQIDVTVVNNGRSVRLDAKRLSEQRFVSRINDLVDEAAALA